MALLQYPLSSLVFTWHEYKLCFFLHFFNVSVSGKLENSSLQYFQLNPSFCQIVPNHICNTLSSCSIAGGARAAGPAGHSSRVARLEAREAGPAGQKL